MKIIASDYDGTLNHGGIDDEKRAAVATWQKKGNLFVLVTGRDKCFCPEMKTKSGIRVDYYLACNGAMILDSKFNTIDACRCEKDVIVPLLEFLFSLGCPFGNVCFEETMRICNTAHEDCPGDALTLADAKEIPYFNQISTALPTFEEAASVTAAVGEKFGDVVNPLQNGTCIDIVPAGMDKAQGIYRLLKICGGEHKDVITVGDNVNDLAMLKEFRSYAMENGVEVVREIADKITPSVTQLIYDELKNPERGNCMHKNYTQPFHKGTLQCERFRIPALCTLNDGSVLAAADIRYGHGSDSPNNIDIALAHSSDGYSDWQYTVVNHFDDYADGVTDKDSASFIDSAVVQTGTGRIIVITDMFPSQGGYMQAKKGTGFADIGGHQRLLLTSGRNDDNLSSFGFYVGAFENGKAVVYERNSNKATAYSVDEKFYLYKNNEPIFCSQKGADAVKVQQNLFYSVSELQVYRTAYLCLRYSDDTGKTWSKPIILSDSLKKKEENFFGICPGRGAVIRHNGKERILFCVYNNHGLLDDPICENAAVIYSDDNGQTWHRSKKTACRPGVTKTSESQLVCLHTANGEVLRMYARNKSNYIAFADSADGGVTWTKFKADSKLEGTRDCMVSFMDTDKTVDGKQMILASAGGSVLGRADGVLRVGLVNKDASVDWIHTYRVNQGFYAYSCLTQLPDGNFGLLYEDEPAHIQYMIFSVSDKGEITEINNNNISFVENHTDKEQKIIRSKRKKAKILFNLGLL